MAQVSEIADRLMSGNPPTAESGDFCRSQNLRVRTAN
jgi:hypothetical protein